MVAHRFLVCSRKALLVIERDVGGGYEIVADHFVGIPVVNALADDRTGTWWVSLDHGHWGPKLHRSDDEGATWVEVPCPAYPDGAQKSDDSAASLEYLWTLAAGGKDEPETLYIGTNPGGLFRSDDGGATFALVRELWDHPSRTSWFGGGRDTPGIHSVVVDPRDSSHLYVGVSCGGVFESHDRGISWHPRNAGQRADFLPDPTVEAGHDPHHLILCPAAPDVLWQQNHCGVYVSDDGGALWREVSQMPPKSSDNPGARGHVNFGFPIVVHPKDPDTAWVLPAQSDEIRTTFDRQLAVYRTQDRGLTWQRQDVGLPQEAAYDLVFRHAFVLHDGTLMFGSTTGNLYASNDGGAQWRAVAHHLPPIYAIAAA